MARIEELDLADRLAPLVPRWMTQVLFGVVCAVAIGVIRVALDWLAAGAAPFALVFPAILLATLFGRWLAGAVTAALTISYAYAFIYVAAVGTAPWLNVAVITLGAALTIVIAEMFRRAVRRAAAERDRQIADRDLFLAEVDHRMKNNFAIVGGLLDLQKRRATDPATVAALSAAQMRVDSIARAHRHLYRDGAAEAGTVEMRDYLADLCAALADALFLRGGIVLTCESEAAAVPRDRAVSIGLVVNELVTNAAKHAFPGRDLGHIRVSFAVRDGGWSVVVADDGVGLPAAGAVPKPGSGLGSRLTEAFARQAGGSITTDSDRTGTRVTLELAG